jgi:uncharacterized protein
MPTSYSTPGVYIEEKNAFPNTVVAVETALPVFIGYTQKAEYNGQSFLKQPVRISSFQEYAQYFGDGFKHRFQLTLPHTGLMTSFNPGDLKNPLQFFYLYNCIRLFYQNGGGNCYILSLGTYNENETAKIDVQDFNDAIFQLLEKTLEASLVVSPDFVSNRDDCYSLYQRILKHCQKTQSRFAIFDVIPGENKADLTEPIQYFRTKIGSEALNYGAAYYPWLNTTVVTEHEIDFNNLDADVDTLLPLFLSASDTEKMRATIKEDEAKINSETDDSVKKTMKADSQKKLHQSLCAASPVYKQIFAEIKNRLNLLPPSAAIAGIYTMVDNTRGVWKAPANIYIASVISPAVNISNDQQQNMNVDAVSGKSVNAIRTFPGKGALVWGARTIDGNSQDWRYISVRRTIIMIEQSLKLACRAYVFEPNDSKTWASLKSMADNFLINLWKQGALAGATPDDAFNIQVGLGTTMTATDILEGNLRVTVMLALTHPAEFIVLTFQQQQQKT